jgi:hypothetical protein
MDSVIVTGASRGIGLGVAGKLAASGYRAVAVARTMSTDLAAAIKEAERGAGALHFEAFDLADIAAIGPFVAALRRPAPAALPAAIPTWTASPSAPGRPANPRPDPSALSAATRSASPRPFSPSSLPRRCHPERAQRVEGPAVAFSFSRIAIRSCQINELASLSQRPLVAQPSKQHHLSAKNGLFALNKRQNPPVLTPISPFCSNSLYF